MSTVVGSARQRFERRRRRRRLRSARPALALVVVAVVLGAGGWLVWFSDVLAVREVEVVGARAVPVRQVTAAADVMMGDPLARVDVRVVRERVEAIPGVAAARVSRSWPSTVRISVTERTAVAVLPRDGQLWLVDVDGVAFRRAPEMPEGVPGLASEGVDLGSESTHAALRVVDSLPADLRVRVLTVLATSPESVELVLRDERRVLWGGADRGAEKARVLRSLLGQEGEFYDVSSPSVVVVR